MNSFDRLKLGFKDALLNMKIELNRIKEHIKRLDDLKVFK